jgi:two-component system sensor histidine kinase EvgS
MWPIAAFILGCLFSLHALAADFYSATLDGNINGPVPAVQLSTAQQSWLQHKGRLTLGVSEPDYPPFDIINFNSKYVGITADYAQLIAQMLQVPVDVHVFASRQAAIAALSDNAIDFLATANGFEAVNKHLVLSVPYAQDNPIFARRSDNSTQFGKDLKGASVAMVYHYLPPEWILKVYPGITLHMYPSNFSAMGSVSFGQNDLFLGDNISADFLSDRRFFNNIFTERRAALPQTHFSFAINQHNTMLLSLIDRALAAVMPSEQQRILTRWGAKSQMSESAPELQLAVADREWLNRHRVLRVALEDNNEPYSFFTASDEAHGIHADVLKEVATMAGFQLQWRKVKRAQQAAQLLNDGDVDLTVVMTGNQQPAPDEMRYTPTFYRDSYVIASPIGEPVNVQNLARQSLRVAVIERDPIIDSLRTDFPHLTPQVSDNVTEAFLQLTEGNADIAIVSLAEAVFAVDNFYQNQIKIDAVFGNKSLQFSIAVAANQPHLLNIVTHALNTITPARMSELSNHWRGQVVINRNFWNPERQKLVRGFLLLSATLIFLLFWIIWLRSLIKRRDKAERKLNDQLRFMRDLIDGTPLPIYVRDRAGKLLLCNASYRTQLGSPDEDMLGKTVHEAMDDGEHADELQQNYRRVIEQGESVVSDRVLRLGHNDYRIIHHWILPYRNGVGEIIGIIGGWYDISERQQRLERLQTDKDQALQASEAKSTFLTTMSHEIRTPMNVIIGMLELAAMQANAGIMDKRSLEIAAQEAKGLLELIGDILDIEGAENGHLSLNARPDNLGEVVHSVCRVFEALARRKGLDFALQEIGTLDVDVLIDPMRFKQIISNLLSNAVKFTEQGSVTVIVQVIEQSEQQIQLKIDISDTGMGVSDADCDTLFSRFSRATNNSLSSQQSSGLGLLICKTLCEMMSGTLTLKSRLGQGTCIEIILPLQRSQKPQPEISVAAPAGNRLAQRVLIVDDYATNREVLSLQLTSLGQCVTAAAEGNEALRLWQQGGFDWVITDCNMPLMDGFALTKNIRRQEQMQRSVPVKIIGLTANALPEERQKCLAAGMDACLFKPVTLATLATVFDPHARLESEERDVNLDELHQLTGNDAAKLAGLLRTYISGVANDRHALTLALNDGDHSRLKVLAHRIKGGAEILAAQRVILACEWLEFVCEQEESCGESVSTLLLELDRLCRRLKQEKGMY